MGLLQNLQNDANQAASDFNNTVDDSTKKTKDAADEAARQAQAAADEAKQQSQAAAAEAQRQADAAAAEARRKADTAHQEAKKRIDAAQSTLVVTLAGIKAGAESAAARLKKKLADLEKASQGLSSAQNPLPVDFVWFKFRMLTADEIALATSVFQGSVDFSQVFLADDLGLMGRVWTFQGHATGNVLIHGGQRMFRGATAPGPYVGTAGYGINETFIHELTHAWQAQNWNRPYGYMSNSVICQLVDDPVNSGSYDYLDKRNTNWREWNAEQQAMLVEDWFIGRGDDGVVDVTKATLEDETKNWRFKFIRDNIRQGID